MFKILVPWDEGEEETNYLELLSLLLIGFRGGGGNWNLLRRIVRLDELDVGHVRAITLPISRKTDASETATSWRLLGDHREGIETIDKGPSPGRELLGEFAEDFVNDALNKDEGLSLHAGN